MIRFMHAIQIWDERTILRIVAGRGAPLTRFMKLISLAGDGHLWGILAMLVFFTADLPFSWLLLGVTAFTIEVSVYKLIKQSTSRQRPFRAVPGVQNLVVPQDEYSFPSGHTAAATVAALLFGTAVPMLLPMFFPLAMLIGLSRIYLGVHYPSDVLMGFTLGVFSFMLAGAVL